MFPSKFLLFFPGQVEFRWLTRQAESGYFQGAGESSGAYTAENNGGFSTYIVLVQNFLAMRHL